MPELDIISNHKTLLTCLKVEKMAAKKPIGIKFRLEKIDEKQFCTSLEEQNNLVCISLR